MNYEEYMEEDRISRDFTWREMVYSETAVKHGILNSPGKKRNAGDPGTREASFTAVKDSVW